MRDSHILTKLKAWCLLVLAAVAAQALVPVSAPEARTMGSPCNPATIDVSTGHARRDELPRLVPADDDADASAVVPVALLTPRIEPVPVRTPIVPVGMREPKRALPDSVATGWAPGRPRAPPRI